jgi:hypothetical protein
MCYADSVTVTLHTDIKSIMIHTLLLICDFIYTTVIVLCIVTRILSQITCLQVIFSHYHIAQTPWASNRIDVRYKSVQSINSKHDRIIPWLGPGLHILLSLDECEHSAIHTPVVRTHLHNNTQIVTSVLQDLASQKLHTKVASVPSKQKPKARNGWVVCQDCKFKVQQWHLGYWTVFYCHAQNSTPSPSIAHLPDTVPLNTSVLLSRHTHTQCLGQKKKSLWKICVSNMYTVHTSRIWRS